MTTTTTTTTPGARECFYLLFVGEETKGQGSEVDLHKDTANEWQGWDFNPWVYQDKQLRPLSNLVSLFLYLPARTMSLYCSKLSQSSPSTQSKSWSSYNGLEDPMLLWLPTVSLKHNPHRPTTFWPPRCSWTQKTCRYIMPLSLLFPLPANILRVRALQKCHLLRPFLITLPKIVLLTLLIPLHYNPPAMCIT